MDHKTMMRRILTSTAYRMRDILRDMPTGFEDFEPGLDARTPLQILMHINVILSGVNEVFQGKPRNEVEDMSWPEALENFHVLSRKLDETIQSKMVCDEKTTIAMYQGPMCDMLTHVGQLALLRRLYGSPVQIDTIYYKIEMTDGTDL